MGQKPLSRLSDKGSTPQVPQASLSMQAPGRAEWGSACRGPLTQPASPAAPQDPGSSWSSRGAGGQCCCDLAGCRGTGPGRCAACRCSQAPRGCSKARGNSRCCCCPSLSVTDFTQPVPHLLLCWYLHFHTLVLPAFTLLHLPLSTEDPGPCPAEIPVNL